MLIWFYMQRKRAAFGDVVKMHKGMVFMAVGDSVEEQQASHVVSTHGHARHTIVVTPLPDG